MMDIGKTLLIAGVLVSFFACDHSDNNARHAHKDAEPTIAIEPTNILEIDAKGMRFEGGTRIASGWTTIRLNNKDNMVHFAMLARLPDGVTVNMYSDDLGSVFQRGYNLMLEGKSEEVASVFGAIPAWVPELTYHGGPGLISGNRSAESTQYLEPGNYVLECYIKSNGIFHSYSPVPGELAMLLPLEVTDSPGNMTEPEANATLVINETGFQLTESALTTGKNSIRVRFDSQVRFPSFVGQDVHVIRINAKEDLQAALDWMDWQTPEGLLVPSPITFLGGINDVMPAKSTAYFTVDLTPGTYAFIGEAPEADKKGLLLEFEIR